MGGLHSFLGGFAGLLKGAVIAAVAVNVFALIVSLSSNGVFGITTDTLAQTKLFSFFNRLLG